MTRLCKALPLVFILLAAFTALPLAAQSTPDCSFTFQFTGDADSPAVANLSGNTPCVNWRITFSTAGGATGTVTFQTSPDASTFTSVPNTPCSSTVQPPCVFQGTNPLTGTDQGMSYFAAYGAYVRVSVSSTSGLGRGTVRGYGAKGATASIQSIGGSGGGGGTIAHTTRPLKGDGTGSAIAATYPDIQLLNATAWRSRANPVDNNWQGIAYGNGTFVSVAYSGTGDRVMTSPDGANWTSRTSPADNNWLSVVYGNGLFVAVASTGTGNRVMTSPDGVHWVTRVSAADNAWASVTFGNGLFVAVSLDGVGNRVMTSPDGITWTSQVNPVDNNWAGVAFGNNLFVAVSRTGTGDRVMTSPDGITWTSQSSAADNSWRAVTYGNGLFVAVASNGTGNEIMTSPDGVTWTLQTDPTDAQWVSVTYGNGVFVSVAQVGCTSNCVMTSPDGINWTNQVDPVDNFWDGVAYGNGVFVAVAASGTGDRIMTAGAEIVNSGPKINPVTFSTIDPTGVCVTGVSGNVQNTITAAQFACIGNTWAQVIGAATAGQLVYYQTNTASSIATYLQATILPFSPKTTLSFPALATGTDTLQNWATNAGIPALTFIPAGAFGQHIHALRTGGGTVTLHAQIWEVSSTGVDIGMIGQTEESSSLTTSEVEYVLEFTTANVYTMGSSASRIVSRVFATVSGSAPTVEIFVGGTADTHIFLPSNSVDVTNFVPYTGATTDVDLGTHSISTPTVIVKGSSTGSATIQGATAQGTPNAIQLPTGTGAAGAFLKTDGGSPQQTSWDSPVTSAIIAGTANQITASGTCTITTTGTCTLSLPASISNVTNFTPGNDFTITQNSVVPFTSVATGALVNTLYLKTGNVGIGTATPNYTGFAGRVLSIASANASGGVFESVNTAADAAANVAGGLAFIASANTSGVRIAQIRADTEGATAANRGGAIKMFTKLDGGGLTERLRIDNTGEVGIGTSAPAYSLDVSKGVGLTGTARFFDQTATTGTTLVTITPGAAQAAASTVLSITGVMQFGGTNTTAAVAGVIGATCPAVTCTSAFTWVQAVSSDGSTVFFPVWK